ncbi:MAG: NAD(P)H-dependent oxidoreductase [Candidatus Solibacter sp.]|nr:NAD(P)H-dependent oxidoreductase [Candidatus Solibacter sp.]
MVRPILRILACTLLAAAAAGAASPVRILIAYHSRTGNTAKMAAAVREGAASVGDVEIVFRKVAEVTAEDIVKADGIVLGTPVEWGNLSAEAKGFLDRVGAALGKAGATYGEGRTAAVFCTAGSPSNGQEMERLYAIAAFLAMRFVVVGGVNQECFGSLGPQAVTAGKPPGVTDGERAEARRFGERFARLTRQLRPAVAR